jgi:hypothetical protein
MYNNFLQKLLYLRDRKQKFYLVGVGISSFICIFGLLINSSLFSLTEFFRKWTATPQEIRENKSYNYTTEGTTKLIHQELTESILSDEKQDFYWIAHVQMQYLPQNRLQKRHCNAISRPSVLLI